MVYKDTEIYARCHIMGSDLFEIDDDGTPTQSLDIFIEHEENRTVVWYELSEGMGEMYNTIQEAKDEIDRFEKEVEEEVKAEEAWIKANPSKKLTERLN